MNGRARTVGVAALVLGVVLVVIFVPVDIIFAPREMSPRVVWAAALTWLVFGGVVTAAARLPRSSAVLGAGAVLAVIAGLDLAGVPVWPLSLLLESGGLARSEFVWFAVAVLLTNGFWTRVAE